MSPNFKRGTYISFESLEASLHDASDPGPEHTKVMQHGVKNLKPIDPNLSSKKVKK